ncbi:MAG: rhodanese-like domain-containing protein [Polyangiaceae bacterium]
MTPARPIGKVEHVQVDAEGAYDLVRRQRYIYVDVRESDAFDDGRPAGAVSIPFSAEAVDEFVAAARARFELDAKLVVGCNSGKRSPIATHALIAAGFVDVIENRTGWDGTRGPFGELREPGWRRAGFPTESGSPTHS